MPFISGGDRYQVMFAALDDMVAPDSEARVIDAFVGSLDLAAMGFGRAEAAERGRPAFEPGDLLRLYLYGYRNGIRSSRKLDSRIGEHMRLLDEADAEGDAAAAGGLPRMELERRLAEAEGRLARYYAVELAHLLGKLDGSFRQGGVVPGHLPVGEEELCQESVL